MPNLAAIENVRSSMRNAANEDPSKWSKRIGPRSICQECRQSGQGDHERILTEYTRTDAVIATLENAVEKAFQVEEAGAGVKLKRPN